MASTSCFSTALQSLASRSAAAPLVGLASTAPGASSGVRFTLVDGAGSAIRSRLLDDGDLTPNGYVAHRTIVPMEEVSADVPRDVTVRCDRDSIVGVIDSNSRRRFGNSFSKPDLQTND